MNSSINENDFNSLSEECDKWKEKSRMLEEKNSLLENQLFALKKYNQIYSSYFMISKIEGRYKQNHENDSIALSEKLENLEFSLKFPKDELDLNHEKGIKLNEKLAVQLYMIIVVKRFSGDA